MKEIRLTQGKVALVDDWNYEWLIKYHWTFGSGYARRRGYGRGSQVFLMHREIMKTPPNLIVDHIDHNKLNNQEYNLRNCTYSHNGQNLNRSDSLQGVCWHKRTGKYASYIKVCGTAVHLGYYLTPEEAALAYNTAAISFFGPNARLNAVNLKRASGKINFVD